MKQAITIFIICTVFFVAVPPSSAGNVAKVGSTEVTDEMFEAFAAGRIRKPVADLTAEEKAMINEELIKLVALGVEARKQKLHTKAEVAAQLELQELSFLAQKYIQQHLEDNPVPQDELQSLYDQKYSGASQTEYKARHILVSSPGNATEIINELNNGGDFIALAARHSIGPSAKSGGDLGWFTKETMVPAFGNAVSTMSKGSHSDEPVQTQFGWHIILKEDERTLPKPELVDIQGELERELQQKTVVDLVTGVRDKAKVKTYD